MTSLYNMRFWIINSLWSWFHNLKIDAVTCYGDRIFWLLYQKILNNKSRTNGVINCSAGHVPLTSSMVIHHCFIKGYPHFKTLPSGNRRRHYFWEPKWWQHHAKLHKQPLLSVVFCDKRWVKVEMKYAMFSCVKAQSRNSLKVRKNVM